MNQKHFFISSNLIFILLVASSCAVNPVSGKKQISLMSEKQEIALGAQYDPMVQAEFGVYPDEKLQAFINEKGQAMARISHRPDLKWTFRVVDSPVVNAFAVPGGYVYFTRGIMAHFNNEAEFAGVLGHEIGHVTARHSAEQYTKQTLGQVLFIGGVIVSKEFRQFADIAQQSMGLLFLKFSRDNESQSDELGVNYSTKIGYDAVEMADFFKTLARLSEGRGSSIPEFQSTHPDPTNRYNNVKELAAAAQAKNTGEGAQSYKVNRESWLRLIDGITYGEDPRQGYVLNNYFFHPVMKFQYPIPTGWQTVNSPSQVQMAPQDGKALMLLTLSGEQTLAAAAAQIIEQYQLTPVDKKNGMVHGMPAIAMINDQVSQDQSTGQSSTVRIQTYLIEYNGAIYVMHGLAALADFNRYQILFDNTMKGFDKLTDPARINVKPELIDVVSVKSSGTVSQALTAYNVPASRLNEVAILNGMELNENITAGELIKIVVK